MSNLFGMISEEERSYMNDYIQRYAPLDGYNATQAPLQDVLRHWEEAKSEHLARMFNGNLILEREIEYEMSINELYNRFQALRNSKVSSFYNSLYNLFWLNSEFDYFCCDGRNHKCENSNYSYQSTYCFLSNIEALLENRWIFDEIRLPLPEGKNFKVTPGTKITRILGRLAKAWNLPDWDAVLEAQSLALTSKKTKGKVCISIHPLDYMTMSDNNENWDSCMNWMDNGSYRAGTIEMMNSPYVVVAYLKSPSNKLDNFWNSKVWRELFIVHEDVITNIKPYPYVNEWLTKYICSWLKDLAEDSNFSHYNNKIMLLAENSANDDEYFNKNNIEFRFRTNTMYNDTGRSDQWIYLRDGLKNKIVRVNYSGYRSCIWCGEITNNFESENELLCCDCESRERFYCEECGARINDEEAYCLNGDYYCYDCFCELAVYPYDSQDEPCRREDCEEIFVKLPDGNLYGASSLYVYDLDWFAKKVFGEDADRSRISRYDMDDNGTMVSCIDFKDCSEEILNAFGMWGRDIAEWKYWGNKEEQEKALAKYDKKIKEQLGWMA